MPLLWLLIGVLSCSTSVIWVKFSTVDPVLLTGMRLAIAALLLSPFAWRDWRKHRAEMSWSHLRDSAIPGVVSSTFTTRCGSQTPRSTKHLYIINGVGRPAARSPAQTRLSGA